MKILVASHTYIVDLNCEKLRAITQIEPNIKLTIAIPKRWRPGGIQNKIVESEERNEGNFRVIPISNFSQNNQGLLTFGQDIIGLLREFRPDIIQVEQGAKSLAYAQLITLNRILKLKAKNIFFTWWNLPYNSKFPVSLLESYNLRNTDGLISGNKDGVDILTDKGYRGPARIVPQLGVDPDLFSPRPQPELASQLGIDEHDFVVGFVGRFVEEKGILTLIEALAGLTQLSWKLLLLGRGPLQNTIIERATASGIRNRLILVESVPHDRVPAYINLMSTLVLPSQTSYNFKTLTATGWKEQFGHVLIEAMACKVALIGSDSGEIPHVIGNAGLIFPEKDALALRNCLQKLIENAELLAKLALIAYQRGIEKYTNRALAEQQLDFYRELFTGNSHLKS